MSHYFTNLRTPKNVTVVSSFTKMQLMTTLFLDKFNDDLAQYSSNHAYVWEMKLWTQYIQCFMQ